MPMSYDKGFDYRWRKHPRPQANVLATWLDKCGLEPKSLAGKFVLDVGCGCGRNSKLLSDAGADVTGVDASPSAVLAAAGNARGHFYRRDILSDDLSLSPEPMSLGKFDYVFSHGVLHHTGNTKQAFMNAAAAVKPGGMLNVWVYCNPAADPRVRAHIDFLHAITRACPTQALYDACHEYSLKLRDMNAGAWDPLSQVLRVSQSEDDDECISDTFDWHCPQYRDYVELPELESWYEEAGFTVRDVGFPTSALGVKL